MMKTTGDTDYPSVKWRNEARGKDCHVGELSPSPQAKMRASPPNGPFVYVSYTGRDGCKEEVAEPTTWFLENVAQVSCFMGEVPSGGEIVEELACYADKCTHALVIISQAFRKRKYCVQEFNTFLKRVHKDPQNLKLLPVLRWDVKDVKDYENSYLESTATMRLERLADLPGTVWSVLIRELGLPTRSIQELDSHLKSYVEIMRGKRAIPRSLEAAVKQERVASMGNVANKVFISYTGRDIATHDFVAKLTNKLQEQEIPSFLCKDYAPVERPWADYIRANAKICQIFIAVLSPLYFTRYWCMQELYIAMTHGRTIMPVCYGLGGMHELPSDKAQFVRAFEHDARIQSGQLDAWWKCLVNLSQLRSVQEPTTSQDMGDRDVWLIDAVVKGVKNRLKVDPTPLQDQGENTNENHRILCVSRMNTGIHCDNNTGFINVALTSGKNNRNISLPRSLISLFAQTLYRQDDDDSEEEEDLSLHRALGRSHMTKEALCDSLDKDPDALYLEDEQGRLLIHMACLYQTSVGIVVELANRWRSSLAFPTKNGGLPLHAACMNKHGRKGGIIEALVGMLPKTTQVQDHMGQCAVHIAASNGASLDVFHALLNHKIGNAQELFTEDKDGMLPLQLACMSGAPEACQSFLCEKMIQHCNTERYEMMGYMADFLRGQGGYDQAERIQRTLLAQMQDEANVVHNRDSLMSVMNNLAITLCNQGKNKEAESLFQTVLKRRIEMLGRKHGDTLCAMANLSVVLCNQGNYKEVAVLYRAVLGN